MKWLATRSSKEEGRRSVKSSRRCRARKTGQSLSTVVVRRADSDSAAANARLFDFRYFRGNRRMK